MKALESLGLLVLVAVGLYQGFAGAAPPPMPPRARSFVLGAPGMVTDLTVVATTDSTATVTWTEVASGDGSRAHYDVRHGPAAGFAWWLVKLTPPDTVTGTTAAGGVRFRHVVTGLKPSTAYAFQAVAFTGTLNVNAVFSVGGPSNVAPGTTAATPPPPPSPPPPPPPVLVARVIPNVRGTLMLTEIGATWQGIARVEDSTGAALVRPVTWRASDPSIASVDSAGLVVARGFGTDTVTATAEGHSAFFLVLVQAPAPPPPVGVAVIESLTLPFGIPMVSGSYGGVFMRADSVVGSWTLTVKIP